MNKTPLSLKTQLTPPASAILLALSCGGVQVAQAEEAAGTEEAVDTISVTASRIERGTKEVSAAISVIDEEKIENAKMFNIKDAIQGTPGVLIDSKNGGYDVRLIIRGAGQKANYGVREIMILRDGVPMTDPDSFSRFDFIDTQDIERIEITKGPGSLYGSGSAGGTIQIISKSVFDENINRVKVGVGEHGSRMLHGRYGAEINDDNAFSVTASHREVENGWRRWNKFDSQQLSLKHGLMLEDGATLETELSYSEADMQLPGSMSDVQFETFKATGEQTETKDAWKHSGRYSTIWFFNSRLEKEFGDLTFTPRVYFNHWDHFHPVTAAINENPGTSVLGGDLEFSLDHKLWGDSTLVAGVTARIDNTEESNKYQYADTQTTGGGRIIATLSDNKGSLMETEEATNTLYGLFLQETLRPTEQLTVDAGFRFDRMNFDLFTRTYTEYNWSTGQYVANVGTIDTDATFDLFAPSLGASYAINKQINLFANIAQSGQVPSEGEINDNPTLDAATARNIEVGIKGRARDWSFDASIYRTKVKDDIIQVYSGWSSSFMNAGETLKKGFEFSGNLDLNKYVSVGASYAFSDYNFVDFQESGSLDFSGNQIPYVPRHQYGFNVNYKHPNGFKARLQTDTWGEYYMDNRNTEKYDGYDFLTSLMLGYETGPHSITLNVDNLFDKRYATEAKKSSSGTVSYAAGSPRSTMLTYLYAF
ncbi:MAG: TonB-dependent receptor [Candidatus Sedimenticola sp. (ex Thyasira tokunagai)]